MQLPLVAASAALVRGICQGILFFLSLCVIFFCYLALADVFPSGFVRRRDEFSDAFALFFRRIMTDH